jgi:hypothetical protein
LAGGKPAKSGRRHKSILQFFESLFDLSLRRGIQRRAVGQTLNEFGDRDRRNKADHADNNFHAHFYTSRRRSWVCRLLRGCDPTR